MSLYNIMAGINPATFLILPMLGKKHPAEYPRFRDCFIVDGEIHIFTRVGGHNRNCGFGEKELQNHPNFLRDEDSPHDNTYATYMFSIPQEWKEDADKIVNGKLLEISDAYKERLYTVFPKLKEQFDILFNKEKS